MGAVELRATGTARAVAHILNMPLIPQEQRAVLLRRE